MARRKPQQLELRARTWGGKREGAGRPRSPGSGVPHRARRPFSRRTPVHVTLRMASNVYGLRSQRSLRVVKASLLGGADRFRVRVVQLSLQGNHVHLLVEAPDQLALARAMKGLSIRLARGMNAMMGRAGRVLGDRYHARLLRTPTEVRRVMHYIRYNHQHHGTAKAEVDAYSSDGLLRGLLPAATSWLLTEGWRRGRSGSELGHPAPNPPPRRKRP